MGETRVGVVNEAYVKTLLLGQYGSVLCSVRVICNL